MTLRAAALAGVLRSLDAVELDRSRILPVGGSAVGVVVDGVAEVYTDSAGGAADAIPVERIAAGAVAGALVWADRQGASSVRLVVDGPHAAVAARLASRFTVPTTVLERVGAGAVPVAAAPVDPPGPAVADSAVLRELLTDAGLEVVEEHGVVTGEFLGLEVARLVPDPAEVGGSQLAVGVGRFDQEATAVVRGAEPAAVALGRTIEAVAPHRRPGRAGHPASTLARERWLRSHLVQDPAVAGLGDLRAVPTTVPRSGTREVAPAAAVGRDANGGPVVVVCSVGADLAFVPVAADTRASCSPSARLLLVVPERDLLPSTRRLADLVVGGAELVGVRAPWDDLDATAGADEIDGVDR